MLALKMRSFLCLEVEEHSCHRQNKRLGGVYFRSILADTTNLVDRTRMAELKNVKKVKR